MNGALGVCEKHMFVNTQHGKQRQRIQRISSYNNRENLKIDPFKILENHLETGWAWQKWIEDFEEETSYSEITEITDKVSAFSKFMLDWKSRN